MRLVVATSITNHKSKKISFFLSSSKNMQKVVWWFRQSVLGAPLWRKRRPNRPRRPWLVSLVISTRLSSPVTAVVFADQLAQLTPTSRQAKRAAIARALGLDVPAPLSQPERREPLRDDVPQARTVPCARTIPDISGYLLSRKHHELKAFGVTCDPPRIHIRRRRAASCAPIDRISTVFGSWVFISTVIARGLMSPCHDDYIVD